MKKRKKRLALLLLAAMLINTMAVAVPARDASAYSDISGSAFGNITHAGEIYTTGGSNTAGMSCINVYVNGSLYGSQCFAEYDLQYPGGWSEVRKIVISDFTTGSKGTTDIFKLSGNAVSIDFSEISEGYDLSQASVEKIICQYDVTSPRTKPPYGMGTTTFYYSFGDNALENAVKSRGIFTGGKYQVFSMTDEDAPDYGSPLINGVLNIYITGVTARNMTVRFDSGCGQTFPDKTVTFQSTYGSLPIPEQAGYTFTGWYKDIAGKFKVTENTYITEYTTEAVTLYAGWKAKSSTEPVSTDNKTGEPDLISEENQKQSVSSENVDTATATAKKERLSKVVLKKYKKGTKVVKGTAKAKSQVILKVNKKKYTVKVTKKGKFTVKLKTKLKKGQKITVYAKLAGYKNSKKVSKKVK